MCGWSPESSDQTELSVNFNSSHTHTHCNNKIEFYVAITQQHFAKEIDSFVSLLASAFTTQQILNRTMFISRERIEFLVSACDIRVCMRRIEKIAKYGIHKGFQLYTDRRPRRPSFATRIFLFAFYIVMGK